MPLQKAIVSHNRTGQHHRFKTLLVFLLLSVLPVWATAAISTGVKTQSGLRSWTWQENGVSLQWVQQFPDQSRAYFQGRGFTPAQSDLIANTCVFQTIFRNDGTRKMYYNLDDWKVLFRDNKRPLLTRERWDQRWSKSAASQAARIALRWSLLPTRQSFQPGDYNWGMTSFGLQPGATFNLTIVISIKDQIVTRKIPNILCATDRPEPQ